MSSYKTGTASVTVGNAVVTGSGTAWAVSLVKSGVFSSAGLAIPIASVTDDTHLTLDYAWPGSTAVGAAYSIARESSDAATVVSLNTTMSHILRDLSLAGIHPNASGTIAERNAITLTTDDEGFLFLHAEIGVAFAFYRWTGTAWEGPFAVANATGGAVSSITNGTGITIDNTNPAIPVISAEIVSPIHAATSKATPVDADEFALVDSAASFGLKKLTWANLKYGVQVAVLALFNLTAKATPVDADRVWTGDSTASFAARYSTWTQVKAFLKTYFDTLYAAAAHTHTFASLTSKPTTLSGYGITDVNYGAGNAALAYGAVGTYAFGGIASVAAFGGGATFAGSSIKPAGLQGTSGTADDTAPTTTNVVKGVTAFSGTWMAMGRSASGTTLDRYTLFLRIS